MPHLRAAAGVRRVLIYANLDWFTHVLEPAQWVDADVLLWIARFNGDPGNTGFTHPNLALHRHTANGTVPGIPGHVDRDVTVGVHTLAGLLVGRGAAAPPRMWWCTATPCRRSPARTTPRWPTWSGSTTS